MVFSHPQQHDMPSMHDVVTIPLPLKHYVRTRVEYRALLTVTLMHTAQQVTLLRDKANCQRGKAAQHWCLSPILLSSSVLLLCCLSDAALMRAVILAGMSALSDTFPLLPAPEFVESHERVSCGALAYSMGKYLPLSYSSTFVMSDSTAVYFPCQVWNSPSILQLIDTKLLE